MLKVLFLARGKSESDISVISKRQGESLTKIGCDVSYYAIAGDGLLAYFKAIPKLRKILKTSEYDVVHAHYGLTGITATLAGAKPLVVSLMGSDVKVRGLSSIIVKIFFKFFWKNVIVKSREMQILLGNNNTKVLPNGVNTEKFNAISQTDCQISLGWDTSKKHILFAANPKRKEKNFDLASKAISKLNDRNIVLHYLDNIDSDFIPIWMNAADIVLLTSLYEGSPNVIKEAMACNRVIVSTGVGDVPLLFENVDGCFLTDFSEDMASQQIRNAIEYSNQYKHSKGRKKILELGLDELTIAAQLLESYKELD